VLRTKAPLAVGPGQLEVLPQLPAACCSCSLYWVVVIFRLSFTWPYCRTHNAHLSQALAAWSRIASNTQCAQSSKTNRNLTFVSRQSSIVPLSHFRHALPLARLFQKHARQLPWIPTARKSDRRTSSTTRPRSDCLNKNKDIANTRRGQELRDRPRRRTPVMLC
jgi:hypothetical protein